MAINNEKFSGAIIDKDWKNYTKYNDLTLKFIINDLEVINITNWCENYLQMVPNEIIDQEYIDALLRKLVWGSNHLDCIVIFLRLGLISAGFYMFSIVF